MAPGQVEGDSVAGETMNESLGDEWWIQKCVDVSEHVGISPK